ncbi:MAG: tetratricopeptide repeat protein, partial [Chloroflexota bacterium]|nr:tetratricopeptide repeat protein [Chloroflexota bacterium]
RPHNLPVERSALLGRERELAQAEQLLLRDDVGLVTLTGPGGTGKTRLVLRVASDLLERFQDGAFFVDLAPISDPSLVASAIAQALDIREVAGRPLPETLKEYLRDRRLLLVLDNFEQILPAASLVSELLAAVPRLKLLVTSRAPLGVRAEYELPVPPLALPAVDTPPSPEMIAQYPAIALFVERATAVRPDFRLTGESLTAVAEICRRLDGLPLAIELAAARCRLLSPMAMLSRLERRLTLLADGPRDLPARQQALRNTIGWSYDLLEASEQHLFRRLAVFVGGFTLGAAEAVRGAGDDDILDGVASLVAKSLVRHVDGSDDEPRFGMLETVREFALEQLEASGEAADARRRHAEYYLGFAEEADAYLGGVGHRAWLARLEREHDNLRAVLAWDAEEPDAADVGLRLAGALGEFWRMRGHLTEGCQWLERGLARVPRASAPERAKALSELAKLVRRLGDDARAREAGEAAVALYRELGDAWGTVRALYELGATHVNRGEYDLGRARLAEAVAIATEAGHEHARANALRGLGAVDLHMGDFATARESLEAAFALGRAVGDELLAAAAQSDLGFVRMKQGDLAAARALLDESLSTKRLLGDAQGAAFTLVVLARVAREQGDFGEACSRIRECLAIVARSGDMWNMPRAIEGCAELEAALGRVERAARLFGSAEAVRTASGSVATPDENADLRRSAAAVRAQLGERTSAAWAAWAAGRAMSPAQAIAYAQEIEPPAPTDAVASGPQVDGEQPDPLTGRQREVAALIARGLTNRQIADQLAVSERTADAHVANILDRLGFSSRAGCRLGGRARTPR